MQHHAARPINEPAQAEAPIPNGKATRRPAATRGEEQPNRTAKRHRATRRTGQKRTTERGKSEHDESPFVDPTTLPRLAPRVNAAALQHLPRGSASLWRKSFVRRVIKEARRRVHGRKRVYSWKRGSTKRRGKASMRQRNDDAQRLCRPYRPLLPRQSLQQLVAGPLHGPPPGESSFLPNMPLCATPLPPKGVKVV